MNKSQTIGAIASALSTFHLKVGKVKKDATNPFFKSKYASLSNILDVIDTPLQECGLAYSQFPTGEHGLSTILMHSESGEWMESTYTMKPAKDDPQGIGSAITYQRRYALAAVLGLNIDDDDDANAASYNGTAHASTNGNSVETKPWLNKGTKEFEGAVNKLKTGATTIEKIKSVMKLSKAVETDLLAEASKN